MIRFHVDGNIDMNFRSVVLIFEDVDYSYLSVCATIVRFKIRAPTKKDRERFLPSPDLNFCCIPHCIIIFH